jgi:hypothetical protein
MVRRKCCRQRSSVRWNWNGPVRDDDNDPLTWGIFSRGSTVTGAVALGELDGQPGKDVRDLVGRTNKACVRGNGDFWSGKTPIPTPTASGYRASSSAVDVDADGRAPSPGEERQSLPWHS